MYITYKFFYILRINTYKKCNKLYINKYLVRCINIFYKYYLVHKMLKIFSSTTGHPCLKYIKDDTINSEKENMQNCQIKIFDFTARKSITQFRLTFSFSYSKVFVK